MDRHGKKWAVRFDDSDANVGGGECWVSAIVGSGLMLLALMRRTLASPVLALGGGYLLYRGFSGHCFLYDRFGVNRALPARLQPALAPKHLDIVAEAGWESFPCSDPPAWTLGRRDVDQ